MVLVGQVKGKMAILIDDVSPEPPGLPPGHFPPFKALTQRQMCDTAGTLCKAATTVKEHGAAEVLAICTHGILSGNAINNLNGCDALSKLVVTNVTLPLPLLLP